MIIDLFHNKIIKDNMSDAFKACVYSELLPLLADKYGTTLRGVQMYEDCLDMNFVLEGEFYYPITLVFDDGPKREWIKWNILGKRRFADGIPFAFTAEGEIGFALADKAPDGFEEKLIGHAMYFEGDALPLKIDAPISNKTLLVGKYSQTFIDEMNRQLNREIENAFAVKGLPESGVELLFVFAPGTYMEHRLDNVTYRRLLITARACAARDFWIKWTPVSGDAPLTVTDNVSAETIRFELGEDVPQKIREKEYRFLVSASSEKYQAAMGRRNITEWRDMIKRVIKRGELTKLEVVKEDPERMGELTYKLQDVLTGYTAPARTAPTTDNSDIDALLRSVLPDEKEASSEKTEAAITADKSDVDALLRSVLTGSEASVSETKDAPETSEDTADLPWETDASVSKAESAVAAASAAVSEAPEEVSEKESADGTAPAEVKPEAPAIDEAELRRIIEAELREKLLKEAEKKAEEQAEELRRAHELLKAQNEELATRAREAEEKLRLGESALEENERLRAELDGFQRAEARDKERMAEAARLALIEQKRMESERAEQERIQEEEAEKAREAARLAEQEALAEAERQRAAEEARRQAEASALAEAERQRAAEEARRQAEASALAEAERQRAAEEARRQAEASALAEAERQRAEEEARRQAEASALAEVERQRAAEAHIEEAVKEAKLAAAGKPSYTYVSKNVRLLFNHPIDPNINKRIHEIILSAIKYFHKENVYMKVKPSIPDSTTVNLHFVKFPEEELDFLVDLIKVLGRSEIGITKAFLE